MSSKVEIFRGNKIGIHSAIPLFQYGVDSFSYCQTLCILIFAFRNAVLI